MNNSYRKRHEENLKAARLLIIDECYCSAIHCSYYSVLQLLLLIHKNQNTEVFRNRNKLERTGSHELLINATFDLLEDRNKLDAGTFSREMGKLKSNRKDSDYNEVYIDKTRSKTVLEMAQNLIALLTRNFFQS